MRHLLARPVARLAPGMLAPPGGRALVAGARPARLLAPPRPGAGHRTAELAALAGLAQPDQAKAARAVQQAERGGVGHAGERARAFPAPANVARSRAGPTCLRCPTRVRSANSGPSPLRVGRDPSRRARGRSSVAAVCRPGARRCASRRRARQWGSGRARGVGAHAALAPAIPRFVTPVDSIGAAERAFCVRTARPRRSPGARPCVARGARPFEPRRASSESAAARCATPRRSPATNRSVRAGWRRPSNRSSRCG
jgi:hypothetical protein